jgi:hypothetical protein
MVVFGPNQVWIRFDVCLNFKVKPGPHVSLLSSLSTTCALLQHSASTICCHCTLLPPVTAPRACRTQAPRHLYDRALCAAVALRHCSLPLAATGRCRARSFGMLKCVAASSRRPPPHTLQPSLSSFPHWAKKQRLLRHHCRQAQSSATPLLCRTRTATYGIIGRTLAPQCSPAQPHHRCHNEPTTFWLFPISGEHCHHHPPIKIRRLRWVPRPLIPLQGAPEGGQLIGPVFPYF